MSYEEKPKKTLRAHELSLKERERLELSGLEDVLGFDDNTVALTTSLGALSIHGSALHIECIDLDSGRLELRGQINEISYEEPSAAGGIWKRLFG